MSSRNDKESVVMMVASMLIVGTIGIFRRWIPLDSALLAFLRGLIGSVSLLSFAMLVRRERWDRVSPGKLATMVLNGAFLGINWILLFEAFGYTTIAKATLAYYLEPTIVVLLSPLVFGERLTAKKLLCAAAALLGMVLVSGVIGSAESAPSDLRGILLGIGAACFYALVVILNKKVEGVNSYQKTFTQLLSAAVVLIPYLLVRGLFAGMAMDARTLALVLVVGIVHTGIVYALYFGSMEGLQAQTISALSYIDPVTAMLVSALVLGEGLSLAGIIGAVLIIGSAIIGELEPAEQR